MIPLCLKKKYSPLLPKLSFYLWTQTLSVESKFYLSASPEVIHLWRLGNRLEDDDVNIGVIVKLSLHRFVEVQHFWTGPHRIMPVGKDAELPPLNGLDASHDL